MNWFIKPMRNPTTKRNKSPILYNSINLILYNKIFYKKVLTQFQARNNIHTSTTQTEITMLDNLAILALGGAAVCAIFVIAELIAKYFDWK